jgi:hypothetical protein
VGLANEFLAWPIPRRSVLPISAADKKESTARDTFQHILCVSLRDEFPQLKTTVQFRECTHVCVGGIDTIHIPGRDRTLPDCDVEATVTIRLANLLVGEHRRTATADATPQFRADLEERKSVFASRRNSSEMMALHPTATMRGGESSRSS